MQKAIDIMRNVNPPNMHVVDGEFVEIKLIEGEVVIDKAKKERILINAIHSSYGLKIKKEDEI